MAFVLSRPRTIPLRCNVQREDESFATVTLQVRVFTISDLGWLYDRAVKLLGEDLAADYGEYFRKAGVHRLLDILAHQIDNPAELMNLTGIPDMEDALRRFVQVEDGRQMDKVLGVLTDALTASMPVEKKKRFLRKVLWISILLFAGFCTGWAGARIL